MDSYFGEFGILEAGSARRWTAIAKKKTIVYSIPREILLNKVLIESEFRNPFSESITNRLKFFKKSERACARAIRRHTRALNKLESVK